MKLRKMKKIHKKLEKYYQYKLNLNNVWLLLKLIKFLVKPKILTLFEINEIILYVTF